MSKLTELAKLNGLSMKQLSVLSDIKYTTLKSMELTDVISWKNESKESIAHSLGLTVSDLENLMQGEILSPFIKWVGGKRQLIPSLLKYLPKDGFDKYYEPFVGGGAFLLRLAPKTAVINDSNSELINTWNVVKNDLVNLSMLLKNHEINDSKEYYLAIRGVDRTRDFLSMSDTERAARFIYMNKAGYNGLWRVNSHGQNNVPYGQHKKLNLVTDSLSSVSSYLNRADIEVRNSDYRKSVSDANRNDFVYFDPPYIPVNQTSSFTGYTQDGFGLIQQEQLRDLALELAERGVKVMLSNADVPLIKDLYSNKVFKVHHVVANRFINSKASSRGKVGEVIITTY